LAEVAYREQHRGEPALCFDKGSVLIAEKHAVNTVVFLPIVIEFSSLILVYPKQATFYAFLL
jgi:hypothetical protein